METQTQIWQKLSAKQDQDSRKMKKTQDEHKEHQVVFLTDLRRLTRKYSKCGWKFTNFNIHTPKTRIYNFTEGRKNKFQLEDKENRPNTQGDFWTKNQTQDERKLRWWGKRFWMVERMRKQRKTNLENSWGSATTWYDLGSKDGGRRCLSLKGSSSLDGLDL